MFDAAENRTALCHQPRDDERRAAAQILRRDFAALQLPYALDRKTVV